MTAFPRRPKLVQKSGAVLTAALLAAGGVAITTPPASATVSTLCVGYTGCAKAGMSDAGYSKASKTMYWRMYSGHNCTNYAAYRMVKAGMANTRPWSGSGNATNWGTSMKSITNGTPRVGAVAWWKAGVYPAGSAGHVAYVEQVVSSSEIIVSMDSWNGDFSWARITKTTKGWPSGFVHFKDVKIVNTASPKVTGTPKVGSTLTATPGSWSVAGLAYTYQWLADGTAISGATASTLALTNAVKDKTISVRVSGWRLGYSSSVATSGSTAAVQPGAITNTAAPTISGDPRVDSTLSAQPGSWNPSPVTPTYRWLADGDALADETSSTLKLTPALVGKAIKVEVTAARTGYTSVKALSAATDPVAPGQMRTATPPSVAGQAAPGGTLRLGSFAGDPRATKRIVWSRWTTHIPGATAASYKLTPADVGHRLRAVVYLSRPGYQQMIIRTAWTPVVRSTPVMKVWTTPGSKRLAWRIGARATWVPDLDGTLQIRSRGKVIRSVAVHNGSAAGTITGLPTGKRSYRFRLLTTSKTTPVVVVRSIKIG